MKTSHAAGIFRLITVNVGASAQRTKKQCYYYCYYEHNVGAFVILLKYVLITSQFKKLHKIIIGNDYDVFKLDKNKIKIDI